jgi:hypothetical protein
MREIVCVSVCVYFCLCVMCVYVCLCVKAQKKNLGKKNHLGTDRRAFWSSGGVESINCFVLRPNPGAGRGVFWDTSGM